MNRVLGSFVITLAFVVLTVLGVAYQAVGMTICAVIVFAFFWGVMDSLFGHHFERND